MFQSGYILGWRADRLWFLGFPFLAIAIALVCHEYLPAVTLAACIWANGSLNRFPQCNNAKQGWQQWNISWSFKSMHAGGAQFLFVDGSVHFLSQNINYQTYQWLGGRNDGNTVGDY